MIISVLTFNGGTKSEHIFLYYWGTIDREKYSDMIGTDENTIVVSY